MVARHGSATPTLARKLNLWQVSAHGYWHHPLMLVADVSAAAAVALGFGGYFGYFTGSPSSTSARSDCSRSSESLRTPASLNLSRLPSS